MFSNRWRKLGTMTYAQNAQTVMDMPRRDYYRMIGLRISGSFTITTVGSGAYGSQPPYNLISRIDLVADGRDWLKSIPFWSLMKKNIFLFSGRPPFSMPAIGTGTTNFAASAILPVQMPKSVRPADTFLNSGNLSTLQLVITWGTMLNFFSTAPTTWAEVSALLEVFLFEAVNLSAKPLQTNIYKETMIQTVITASQSALTVNLPLGNLYRGFLIEELVGTTVVQGVPTSNIITNIQIVSGTTVFYNSDQYQAEFASVFSGLQLAAPARETGYTYIDLCPEGRIVDGLNSANLPQLQFVMSCTLSGGQDFLNIYPCEIVLGQAGTTPHT
jgi:hypothetical protein